MKKDMIRKLLALAAMIGLMVILTGCSSSKDETIHYVQDEIQHFIAIDKETCVQYIRGYNQLSVRLNTDGTPMLSEECLERKGKER